MVFFCVAEVLPPLTQTRFIIAMMEADEELRCNRIAAKLLEQEKEHLWCRQTKDISTLLYVFETENDCFRRLRKRSTAEMRTCVVWWATPLFLRVLGRGV